MHLPKNEARRRRNAGLALLWVTILLNAPWRSSAISMNSFAADDAIYRSVFPCWFFVSSAVSWRGRVSAPGRWLPRLQKVSFCSDGWQIGNRWRLFFMIGGR